MPASPPFILITAFGSPELHERAAELGAARVVDKPFDLPDLLAEVSKLVSADVAPRAGAETPLFPCEVVLRHDAAKKPIKALVRSLASRLNRFAHLVERCEVICEETAPHEPGRHHHHITIHLTTADQPVIVTHAAPVNGEDSSLYRAITAAFHTAVKLLSDRLDRHHRREEKGGDAWD